MKKGQMGGVGVLIIVAVAVIVGVVLFQIIAQEAGSTTNTVSLVNDSQTLAANGESIYLTDYRALSDVVILNATDNATIAAGNYTVTNNVIDPTTSGLSVKITTDDAEFESNDVYISATAQPVTYVADAGGRAAVNLIVIFFALAVLAVALYPLYKGELSKLVGM